MGGSAAGERGGGDAGEREAAARVREAAARVRARGGGGGGLEWGEEETGPARPARSRVLCYADGLAVGIAGAVGVSFFIFFYFFLFFYIFLREKTILMRGKITINHML
jgi:hypothetical protein